MTYLILIFTGSIILLSIIWVLYLKKLSWLVIPTLFLIAFGTIFVSFKYIGYAVDSSTIPDGTEAIIVNQFQSDPYIYYTLLFSGEKELRLVKVLSTDSNKEENKKADANANKVIKFGKKKIASGNGNSKNSNSGDDDADIAIIPFSESKTGQK